MQTRQIQVYSRNTRPQSLPSKCNSPIYPTFHSIFIGSTKPIGRKNMLEPEVYYGPAGWPPGWVNSANVLSLHSDCGNFLGDM